MILIVAIVQTLDNEACSTPVGFQCEAHIAPNKMAHTKVIRSQKVVLAEYTALAGNFQQATIQILQKLESALASFFLGSWVETSWNWGIGKSVNKHLIWISFWNSSFPHPKITRNLPRLYRVEKLHLRRICLPLHRGSSLRVSWPDLRLGSPPPNWVRQAGHNSIHFFTVFFFLLPRWCGMMNNAYLYIYIRISMWVYISNI